MAFLISAVVVGFSAASFAEFSTRLPVSAGEAAYVRAGFRSDRLALIVGLMVIAMGTVSSAAIAVGSTGYVREFLAWPDPLLATLLILGMGAIAAWGILESVTFASIFTLIEVGALLALVAIGFGAHPQLVDDLPRIVPDFTDTVALSAIAGASLLAFFAFIGFEDIVNLAEEVKNPGRTLPWAIFLTLVITTTIYMAVASVAVLSVPIEELAASRAPLSLVFGTITGASPAAITAVAIVATLNGVIIQIIMAARVLYGLARQKRLPAALGAVNARTRTPLNATLVIIGIVLVLALALPLGDLAEWTSRIALATFALVNASLWLMKWRGEAAPQGAFTVPAFVPAAGFISCLALLASDFLG
ncbi:amino acid permease [Breoghania sp. L-A4]|uniref:APC family permease n=1 Tax=Breoghania sp. L-A4 TaxID=2304600 RepID=UPI0020C10E4A|nr:amino acid permease [Breoghania sp. L-A4]